MGGLPTWLNPFRTFPQLPGGGGGSSKPLWGIDGNPPFPSAYRSTSDASTWSEPDSGPGSAGATSSIVVNEDGTLSCTVTSLIAAGLCSQKAWHRFDLSNIVPADARPDGTPSLAEGIGRYGLAIAVEVINESANPLFAHGVIVGIGDATTPPASGGVFVGIGPASSGVSGALVARMEGHTSGGGNNGVSATAGGKEICGFWFPVMGRIGSAVMWARVPYSTSPTEVMPTTSGGGAILGTPDITSPIPTNPALYILQGCGNGSGGNSPATSTLKLKITVAPFPFYQPGISSISVP